MSVIFSHLPEIAKPFGIERVLSQSNIFNEQNTDLYSIFVSELYVQNQTEDSIRKELIALQEDKHNYETTAKESLRRVLQEKIEVVRKLSEVEVLKFHVCSGEIVITAAT